nr:DUF4166 domain-containing protein [Leucobacter weissii]
MLAYVSGPPDPSGWGVGRGEFEIAGSRFGPLLRLARPILGPGMLVTRRERRVPFTVVDRPWSSGDGEPALATGRVFGFRGGSQRFIDVLLTGPEPGALRNVLGARGRVELLLDCGVDAEGRLILRSRSMRLRIGRRRLRLPRLLGIAAESATGFDAERQCYTISARARHPVLGTVLEYRGDFAYEHLPGPAGCHSPEQTAA